MERSHFTDQSEQPSFASVSDRAYQVISMLKFMDFAYNNHIGKHDAPITEEERLGGHFLIEFIINEAETLKEETEYLLKRK